MLHSIKVIFNNTIRMKSTWLYWLFACMPFVIVLAMSINSEFLKFSGDPNSLSAFEFFSMIYAIVNNLMIPIIILSFIASKLFYEENHSGIIFYYKDINRHEILFSKWFSLLLTHIIFIFLLFLTSMIVYYFYFSSTTLYSGNFLPSLKDTAIILLPNVSLFLIIILIINFSILFSLKFTTGMSIIFTLIFFLFTTIAPMLQIGKYFVPNGLDSYITNSNYLSVLLFILLVFSLYFFITYFLISKIHKNIEY